MSIYWRIPPAYCEKCEKPIVSTFVDSATKRGLWGCLCLDCHRRIGVGLGLGRGELYRKQDDGRFLKTEG